MSVKLLSILGIVASASCLGVATRLYPAGYDWSRDYISTLLRGPLGPARILADTGVLLFCVSIALIFERLSRAAEFSGSAKIIRIGGIGSQVYAGLTITPMHDLMVTISFVFMLVSMLAIAQGLYVNRETGLLLVGCVCVAILVASAGVYYSGQFMFALPWAQKGSLVFFALWMLSLDAHLPRMRSKP